MGADRASAACSKEGRLSPDNRSARRFDAILYMATTGCQWRVFPNDFPPVSAVRRYFYDWRNNGLLNEMNRHLVAAARRAEGRAAYSSASMIDSQGLKTTECGEGWSI